MPKKITETQLYVQNRVSIRPKREPNRERKIALELH